MSENRSIRINGGFVGYINTGNVAGSIQSSVHVGRRYTQESVSSFWNIEVQPESRCVFIQAPEGCTAKIYNFGFIPHTCIVIGGVLNVVESEINALSIFTAHNPLNYSVYFNGELIGRI